MNSFLECANVIVTDSTTKSSLFLSQYAGTKQFLIGWLSVFPNHLLPKVKNIQKELGPLAPPATPQPHLTIAPSLLNIPG